METDEFWNIIETARSRTGDGRAFDEVLVDLLADRGKRDILEYQECFDELHGAIGRWDVWAAAYLIGGGCSDDSFMDFRAGLIALGRQWYERAAAAPDSLAEHPTVITAAPNGDYVLFYEAVNYASAYAFKRITGDEEDFYEAWDQHCAARPDPEHDSVDMGEDFDFDDPDEMHRRLPRLAALYLTPGEA
ncbi:DUF4240 domain-containing protein [Streptomyces sp. NPDC001492]